MKTKDFKKHVAYVRKQGARYHSPLRKAVIVSLDKRYSQPSKIMDEGFKTVVEESKGSGAGYLVIESRLDYPTERLIIAAAGFSLPTTGETWPYALTRGSLKRKRESWGQGVERVFYGDTGFLQGLSVALWLPQAFDHEFESVDASNQRAEDQRKKLVTDRHKNRVTKEQRINSLLDGISDLELEGVSEGDIYSNDGKRRSTTAVSLNVLEALLKRAG